MLMADTTTIFCAICSTVVFWQMNNGLAFWCWGIIHKGQTPKWLTPHKYRILFVIFLNITDILILTWPKKRPQNGKSNFCYFYSIASLAVVLNFLLNMHFKSWQCEHMRKEPKSSPAITTIYHRLKPQTCLYWQKHKSCQTAR